MQSLRARRFVFRLSIILLSPAVILAAARQSPAAFELADGERVVLLGSTIIEREAAYGYWEAMLTSHFPRRNIIFRNLGWSGDTVWGESRAGFGTAADGFKALVEHTIALKPTTILIAYGTNESFAGPDGLPHFQDGLLKLLAALAPTKARIVLMAPLELERLKTPLPDPSAENKNVWHYGQAIHDLATERDYLFLDLGRWLKPLEKSAGQSLAWTDDTMHLTQFGYWLTAAALENDLQLRPSGWTLELDSSGKPLDISGGRVEKVESTPQRIAFNFTSTTVPVTAALREPGRAGRLRVRGLAEGEYELKIDGQPAARHASERWAAGLGIDIAAETRQAEALRQAIVKKNELYFYRWRPQNETYLFGFRKHEQGQNANEIVEFDPLVADQEREIATLRAAKTHHFELTRVAD